MRKSIARSVFSALIAVLAAGPLALAQGPGPGMGMGRGFADHRPPFEKAMGDMGRWWNNPKMIERLKLTDDQRKAMDQILYQHKEKLIDLQANLQRAELAMEPLMSSDQPDRATMEAQIDKIVTARADLERANAMFLLDIRMKLTPDQWKQLKDMRQDMMMGRRHGRMDHDGGPGQDRMWHGNPNGPGGPGGPPDWHHSPDGQDGAAPQPGTQQANPPAGNPPAGQQQ